jgi:hypothetical protein
MNNSESRLMDNVREMCKQYDGRPEVVFIRGKIGSGLQKRQVLMMLAGPRFTVETLRQWRKDMLEALDQKEAQLLGKPLDPGTAVVPI